MNTPYPIHFLSCKTYNRWNLTQKCTCAALMWFHYLQISLETKPFKCVNAMNSGSCNIQTRINSDTMTKLLELFSKESVFMFEGKCINNRMGLPWVPCWARCWQIFFCCTEVGWLDDCPTSFKPLYCRRSVDDTFVYFASPNMLQSFLHISTPAIPIFASRAIGKTRVHCLF